MPGLRPCLTTRCPRLVRSGHCEDHGGERQAWQRSAAPAVKRIRGRALQVIRARVFAREPWCRLCRALGLFTSATIVDHILNLADGGQETDENRQPLCQACSDAKTQEEARRGRG